MEVNCEWATGLILILAALLRVSFYAAAGTEKVTKTSNVSKVSKCGLVGSWQGNITIPDGADGVPAMLLLHFSAKGHAISLAGTADNKPLVIQNVMATCNEFSFVLPQKDASVHVSGKLSSDESSLSGTPKRHDVMTSWILQRQ